jgi:HPt (histidine-containing phosphotransfer) domain-containing protein
MSLPPEDFMRFLEEQRQEYRRGIPAKLEQMEAIVERLERGDATADLAGLERLAHSMAGSGGTFGFEELGVAAKALERSVQRLKEAGSGATPSQRAQVRAAMRVLHGKLPRG